jgi:hypothetical protein
MTSMPDITRFRRPPVILPPMIRATDSSPSKKSSDQPKPIKRKSSVKTNKSALEKEKDDLSR